jgi:hypothetical protein
MSLLECIKCLRVIVNTDVSLSNELKLKLFLMKSAFSLAYRRY